LLICAAAIYMALAAAGTTIIPASSAKSGRSAAVYDAQVRPAGGSSVAGDAHLVDGPEGDQASVHLHGLKRNVTYTWHVHREIWCIAAPCDPPQEPGWSYGKDETFKGNKAGRANLKATSKSFTADPHGTYLVVVRVQKTGETVAVGRFAPSQGQAAAGQTASGQPDPPEHFQP
jgi:hypothetical protein